jgi:hypothetical protein
MIPAEHSARSRPALDHDDDDDQGDELRGGAAASRAALQPFRKGDPRASEMGKRGAETRRRRTEAERLRRLEPLQVLELVGDSFKREALGPLCAAAAVHMIGEVVSGRQRVRDPAAWVRVLVDVARLEAGEVTSATATVAVTADDVRRAVELREVARRALGDGKDHVTDRV